MMRSARTNWSSCASGSRHCASCTNEPATGDRSSCSRASGKGVATSETQRLSDRRRDDVGGGSDIDGEGIVGRFKRLELAVQQAGVHEVPGPGGEPLADQFFRAAQVDVADRLGRLMPKKLLVGVFQGGTGQDKVLSTVTGLLDAA